MKNSHQSHPLDDHTDEVVRRQAVEPSFRQLARAETAQLERRLEAGALSIRSDEENEAVGMLRSQLRGIIKGLKADHAPLKAAAKKTHSMACQRERDDLVYPQGLDKRAGDAMAAWILEQQAE